MKAMSTCVVPRPLHKGHAPFSFALNQLVVKPEILEKASRIGDSRPRAVNMEERLDAASGKVEVARWSGGCGGR